MAQVVGWRVLGDEGFADEVMKDWKEDMARAAQE